MSFGAELVTSAKEPTPEGWVFDPPTGTLRSGALSAELLLAAETFVGKTCEERILVGGKGNIDDGLKLDIHEYGCAFEVPTGATEEDIRQHLRRLIAPLCRVIAQVDYWYLLPHLRRSDRMIYPGVSKTVVAFYGIGHQVIYKTAEQRFRKIVKALLTLGVFPSPGKIRRAQGRDWRTTHESGGCNLNGKESKWRAEELTAAGYERVMVDICSGRWKKKPLAVGADNELLDSCTQGEDDE